MQSSTHRRWLPFTDVTHEWGISASALKTLVAEGQLTLGQIGQVLVVSEVSLQEAITVLDPASGAAALEKATKRATRKRVPELSLTAAAATAGVSPKTLRRAIKADLVDAKRKGPGRRATYVISPEALAQWQADRQSDSQEVLSTAVHTTARLSR